MLALNHYDHLTLENVETFSEQSKGYFLWKDRNYHFLGGNSASSEFIQLMPNDYIGLTDSDLDWLAGGHTAGYFNQIDEQVMTGQRVMTNEKEILLKKNKEGEIVTRIMIASKRPLLRNGICLGVALEAFDITHTLFPTLFQNGQVALQKDPFSPRELDCIKLLMFGYSYKRIASKLDLSTRTIEYYIENIKRKLDCCNKQMLIDKLLQMGYVPGL